MNIAICTDTFVPMTNGAAVFIDNLAKGLASRGHKVLVICPSFKKKRYRSRRDGFEVQFLSSARFPFYPDEITPVPERKTLFGKKLPKVAYKNGIWWAKNPLKEVNRALDRFHPDVIHIQTPAPVGLAGQHYAQKHNVPQVTTSHNYPDTALTGHLNKLLQPMKRPLDAVMKAYMASFIKNSECATLPTEVAINDLVPDKKRFRKIPVSAISNGVDLSDFRPGKPKKSLLEKYHVPADVPVVLHVGRLDPEKSIATVVRAFAKLLKTLPSAILLLVGDGTERENLENLAKSLKIESNVIFTGRVFPPELNHLYQLGIIFVTASEVETQGIVLLEAAATGLPLVAVNRGAASEACREGINGILCKPGGDVAGLARAMQKLLSDRELYQKLSQGSLSVAKENDVRETIRRFEEVYSEAVKIGTAHEDIKELKRSRRPRLTFPKK